MNNKNRRIYGRKILLFLFFVFPLHAHNIKIHKPAKPSHIWQIRYPGWPDDRLDPSGILRRNDSWWVVGDKNEFRDIYRLNPTGKEMLHAEVALKLDFGEAEPKSDYEGLAKCGDKILIVEEKQGAILEVDAKGNTKEHVLDLNAIHESKNFTPASGSKGAGLEGIACDAQSGLIYVANERQFRMIYVVDQENYKVIDFFDVPAGWDSPRFEDGRTVYPDYADLFYEKGYLYALQRNDRKILKIHPDKKKLVAVLPLALNEKDYYDYKEPFGMAEAIYLTQRKVYVLLDNNGVKLKDKLKDISPLLMEFPRPKGF